MVGFLVGLLAGAPLGFFFCSLFVAGGTREQSNQGRQTNGNANLD